MYPVFSVLWEKYSLKVAEKKTFSAVEYLKVKKKFLIDHVAEIFHKNL